MDRKNSNKAVVKFDQSRPAPYNLYMSTYEYDNTLSYTPPHRSPEGVVNQLAKYSLLPFRCTRCNAQLANTQITKLTTQYVPVGCACPKGNEMYISSRELSAAFATPPKEPLDRLWIEVGLKCWTCAAQATWVCNFDWNCICLWCDTHKPEGAFELDNPDAPRTITSRRKRKTTTVVPTMKKRGRKKKGA